MKSTIAVTGAFGFVGGAVCAELLASGFSVRAVVRQRSSGFSNPANRLQVTEIGEISKFTEWAPALSGVDCVIHCAGRVHVMHDQESNALAAYRTVNVEGTRQLAEQAARLGVKRLIFLSSLKVNGEQTASGSPFTSFSEPAPQDAYGQSKWEAENVLSEVSLRSGIEIVIIRPALVYGPGVKGNLRRLLTLVRSGLPLPFAGVRNHRALVGLGNLVHLLIRCVEHPDAAGKTFLAADGEDLSTPDLLRRMAAAMGKSVRLLPVPAFLLATGRMFRRSEEIDRLLGSLQVDISYTRQVLQWSPPFRVDDGLLRMVNDAPDPRV